jgi:hypothetical protein
MVEGLRTSRPYVKFRRILPLAAVLFVAISTLRFMVASPRTIRTPRGIFSLSARQTRPEIVATAVNLPAFVFAMPLELAILGEVPRRSAYYEPFRLVEFSVIGILFWFYSGRAIDDWIAWRQLRSGSRWRLSDCLVAALTALEATLLGVVFAIGFKWERAELWYLASSVAWAILGYWAFLFRIVQFRAYPRVKTRSGQP